MKKLSEMSVRFKLKPSLARLNAPADITVSETEGH